MTQNVTMCVIIMTPPRIPPSRRRPPSPPVAPASSAPAPPPAARWRPPGVSRDVCIVFYITSVVTSHLLATPSCLRAQQGAASSLQRGHTAVDRGHALAACKCRVSAVLLCRASNKAPTTGTSVCSSSPRCPHPRTPRSSCTWPPGRPPPPARPPAAARSAAAWHEDTVRDTWGITRLT